MYGTVLFESAYRKEEKPDYLEIIINSCDKTFEEKLVIFKTFEKQFANIEENIIDEFLTKLVDTNWKVEKKF